MTHDRRQARYDLDVEKYHLSLPRLIKTLKDAMSIERYFQSIVERLHSSANVRTVYGDPVETQGKTVIPVSRVRYAFGSGPARLGEAGTVEEILGGGGAVQAEPVGIFEVTDAGTRYVPLGGGTKEIGWLLAGFLVGFWIGRWGTR